MEITGKHQTLNTTVTARIPWTAGSPRSSANAVRMAPNTPTTRVDACRTAAGRPSRISTARPWTTAMSMKAPSMPAAA